jgi:AcrR family transcriptional regulator
VSTASARRKPVQRRRDEAKALFRNAILEAAEHVFAKQGFHGARIQDIAEHARIAVGTVYNHFEQKEDVLRALLEERAEGMLEQFAPRATDPGPFDEKLRVRVARILNFVERHRDFFIVAFEHGLFSKGHGPGAGILCGKRMRHLECTRTAVRALVEEGIASGALRSMDPAHLSWFLGGLLKTFALGMVEQGVKDLEAQAPIIVDLFLNGAGSRTR